MKKFACIAAAAVATFATPSYAATDGYVDGRVGIAFVDGYSNEAIALAVGYDFDIGTNLFLGAEVLAVTDASFASPVIGSNTRIGVKVSEADKVFATVGYAYDTSYEIDTSVIGAGYEHQFGQSKVSIQYQRSLAWDLNVLSVGLGFKF